MDQIRRYSTASAGSHSPIAYWNSLLRSLLIPLRVTPKGSGEFEAALEVGQVGSTQLASIRSTPAVVDHDLKHIEQIEDRFFALILCIEGDLEFASGGADIRLGPGDSVLYDSHVQSRLSFDMPHEALSIKIRPKSLGNYIPSPEQFLGIPIRREHTLGRLIGEMLLGIRDQIRSGLPAELANPLRRALLQLLASYFAVEHRTRIAASSKLDVRRMAIQRHIEAHLTDPTLSVASIGKAFKLSTRYVFRAFAAGEETLTAYIQRRRLEQISYYLTSALWSHWTITEIALHWGFTSVPHFSRLFKQRYGMTPGDFRRQEAADATELRA